MLEMRAWAEFPDGDGRCPMRVCKYRRGSPGVGHGLLERIAAVLARSSIGSQRNALPL
jgi:hypothetical protein